MHRTLKDIKKQAEKRKKKDYEISKKRGHSLLLVLQLSCKTMKLQEYCSTYQLKIIDGIFQKL